MKTTDKNSNVSLFKLIAAIMVLLCHSYPLTGNGSDFLIDLTSGKLGLGFVAVSIFFTFSGYYLSKSLERCDDSNVYLKKRVFKIFPPLIAVVMVSIFIIGPVFTSLSLKEYFVSKETYFYFFNALLIPVHELPGVFTNAPYNPTINGSLWTLPVEFGCYIFLLVLYKLQKRFNKEFVNILLLAFIFIVCPLISSVLNATSLGIFTAAISPFSMFCMGHLYWEYKEKIFGNKYTVLLACVVLLVGLGSDFYSIIFLTCFPFLVLTMVNNHNTWIKNGLWEQISYEIYLWGFPIGQVLVELFPGISVAIHFVATTLIAVGISILLKKVKIYS